MSVLEILTIPDKRLKYKSLEVTNFDKDLENKLQEQLKQFQNVRFTPQGCRRAFVKVKEDGGKVC